jgi:thiamine-monophosphate kinase
MEFTLIDIFRERCAIARADVRLGIGDDGAVLAPPAGHDLVAVTDTLVAGVHFPVATRAEDIGWKSLAVNLSDLAAMGATPGWALLALTLPEADRDFVERFADGFASLAGLHRVALVGGDTTRGPLTVTVTALGFVPNDRALRRDGARPGDLVFVTGTLGDAAGALRLGARTAHDDAEASARDALRARLDRPEPRIAAGAVLRGVASACIDVSDGLLADAAHIAAQSGVGIDIDADALPVSSALLQLFDASTRRAFQCGGGDDYELVFTLAEAEETSVMQDLARLGCGATRIGRVVEGAGVRLVDRDGADIDAPARGWDHFA